MRTTIIRGERTPIALLVICAAALVASAPAAELVDARIESDIVPSPVEYFVLLPDGYEEDGEPLPLLFNLHGGGGNRNTLRRLKPALERLWASGTIPKMVVVTPSVTPRSFYMNYKDGTEMWEDFIVGPFLDFLRETYNVRRDREGTMLTGVSMGGQGSLRMAFKYPEKFGAVAALEPGIDPVLEWKDIKPRNRFWRSDRLLEASFGKPFDAAYWEANNPATIVHRNPDSIRDSGLKIYLECGDQDLFWLYEATEFMHRVLYDNSIEHEYHLVHGADHVGASLGPRIQEALEFLASTLSPPPDDPVAARARERFERLKGSLKSHFER